MKMSSFADAKILIATNIFKEIDEWIIVEVEGKSYKVKDSMGLLSLVHEFEVTGVKSQGDKILSHIAPTVTDPMKPINEGKEVWDEPIVFDSGNNIRA
ncbi:hypothetical protein RHSIM_Rhsim01G0234900 [Rhododendron simsii]|uniref:Uncharacterized protein n=1 Tax=Rhododendron simsii TaxID=118357 RepID=A0A834HI17_RHOSS|nr:hypothetical protein RHSIM_Rhsim01G0234900 [Rhododendron simsii]